MWFLLNKNYSIIADLSTWSIVVALHCVESTATVYQSHAVVNGGRGVVVLWCRGGVEKTDCQQTH